MASYFILPMAITSMAKIAPVNGVPNTAPKPAATPANNMVFTSFSSSFNHLANSCATLPPICTAVPSRPAEPPNKCVKTVVDKTRGVDSHASVIVTEY